MPRFLGPFPVIDQPTPLTVELHLPTQYTCHNVFHVNLIRRYVPREGQEVPPPPETLNGEAEWEVDEIIGHKGGGQSKDQRKVTHYLVRWKGYTSDYDNWEPKAMLTNAKEHIQAYWDKKGRKKPKDPP